MIVGAIHELPLQFQKKIDARNVISSGAKQSTTGEFVCRLRIPVTPFISLAMTKPQPVTRNP